MCAKAGIGEFGFHGHLEDREGNWVVVRSLIGPVTVAPDKLMHWESQIALAADWNATDLGLAAFVQSTRSGEVFRATAQAIQ